MKNLRKCSTGAALAMLIAAQGCFSARKASPPIEAAVVAADLNIKAAETINPWWDLSSKAARLLISEYGVPDEIAADRLVWNNKGSWRRTIVRNVRPPAAGGKDLGIVEQTVFYPLAPTQIAALAAFDERLVYAPEKQELSSRSDREEFNTLRLNLGDDVVQGRLLPEQARDAYFKIITQEAAGNTAPDLLHLRITPPSATAGASSMSGGVQ